MPNLTRCTRPLTQRCDHSRYWRDVHVHRRRPSVRQLEQIPRINELVVARCTLCTGQSSANMTHVGAMYSAPDAGAAHQLELVSTRQKGCQDCGPLGHHRLASQAGVAGFGTSQPTNSFKLRTDWFLTKMATTKASARTTTTLPPTYTRKFVIFTPLRSVHHQKRTTCATPHLHREVWLPGQVRSHHR